MRRAATIASRRLLPLLGLAALVALFLGLKLIARRSIFPRRDISPRAVPADFHVLSAVARDGVDVRALELRGRPGGPLVVHFHNNRERAEDNASLARELARRGAGVVLAEFRGYGASPGDPSEGGLYLDAEAILDALDARGDGADQVVLWGQSLGSGVAAEMAARGRGRALILVAPYTSIPDLVTDVVPLLPARWLIDDRFSTGEKVASIAVPTVVIHGDRDEVVPFWMGQRIAGAIAGARLLRVRDGRHGDLFGREGQRLLDEVAGLL